MSFEFIECSPGDASRIVAKLSTADADSVAYNGTGLIVPSEIAAAVRAIDPSTMTVAALVDYAAKARYAKEVGGVTWIGMTVATDRDSQSLVTGLRAYAQDNPGQSISFVQGGAPRVLTASQALALFSVVAGHVQACRAAEATLIAGIESSPPTIIRTAQIDAAFSF